MQLIILSAFAVALWLGPRYQPYLCVSSGWPTTLLVLVHPLAVWGAAGLVSAATLSRLRSTPAQPERGQRILARGTVALNGLVIGGL